MQNLYNDLTKLLEKDERVFAENKILKNKVAELALKLDGDLLKLLLKDKKIKEHFFVSVGEVLVFDRDKFIKFINNKEFLPDSFTTFKNHIGLVGDDEYLKDTDKVVLAWPYKDCVLEGGQDKKDSKRNEIFYNEILAPDEIDRLFEPKVLTNLKRIDKNGEHKVEQITEQDNLIIKGNNLLALHSLKKKYRGKIKLIYIDPPYNTGNDGFNYNDSFNHSTWLTFMENRLKVAKEMLSDDGSIFVQSDYNESHYLKVLMDEIFGLDNFRNEIIWHYENKFKFQFTKNFNNDTESILFYSKKSGQQYFKHIKIPVKDKRKQNKITWDKDLKKMVTVKDENGNVVYYESTDKIVGTLWNIPRINSQSSERLGLLGQKPEALLQRVIEAVTEKNDFVLDFFAGTGTTLAVAHKMGRKWIGIEQLDYSKNNPEERMKGVIAGDGTGISKELNWKGGGAFVYSELKEWNEEYMQAIKQSKTKEDHLKIYKKMQQAAFFRYELDLSKFEQKEFSKLSIEDQKKVLMHCLDKNHLYVNYSDIDDLTYKIPVEEKRVNKKFYGN